MVLFKEAREVIRDAGIGGHWLCQSLEGIAVVNSASGDPLQAAILFGAANAEWRASGRARYAELDRSVREQHVRALGAQLVRRGSPGLGHVASR